MEIYHPDQQSAWFPKLVRFPIDVTHDVPNSNLDSIAGIVMSLCYEHTSPSKYCSLSYYWSKIAFSGPALARSIFRDLDGTQNWMLDLYEQDPLYVWANIIIYLDGTSRCYFTLIPTTQPRMGDVEKRLLSTMTFKLEDTMMICIDSCFFFFDTPLVFARMDAVTYVPRHLFPVCETVVYRLPYCGDSNGDSTINLTDIVYLINYLYRNGDPPNPLCRGDANCDGVRDLVDVIVLINFLYRGGSAPCFDCCAVLSPFGENK